MKHSEVLFNRDLYELTYNNLEDFFQTQKDESLNLEFKSYVAQGNYKLKEEAIKKAICGLLNSEGGIVIWGAPIEVIDAHGKKSAVGTLTAFESNLDRDRLINIFSSSISPMPIGIRVQALQNPEGLSIFIIEVEKSIEKPHQFDNRYYIRLDGQTRIAPHYLISAMMKGTTFPVLRGHLRLQAIRNHLNNIVLDFRKVLFNTSPYINDININFRIIASSGMLIIDGKETGSEHHQTFPLLTHGAPTTSDFRLLLPKANINCEINIAFQFGGEKSPSKMSKYKYQFSQFTIGKVLDENIYLIEKNENNLPAVDHLTINESIENILNQF